MLWIDKIAAYKKLREFKQHRIYKYALSFLLVSLATLIQKIFWPWIGPSPYLLYYPAVIFAAMYGDGNSAIALSCILAQYYFVDPYGVAEISFPDGYIKILIFIISAELIKKVIRIQTENKLKAEAAVEMLQQREKDLEFEKVAREKFVSALSHDLQTPLATVRLNAQMLKRHYEIKDEKINDAMIKQIRNINRIESMVKNLLDANSIRAGVSIPIEITECNLYEIIITTINNLTHIHGERFAIHCPKNVIGFWSADGISRILENLCTNAVKYGDEKAIIAIDVDHLQSGVFIKVNNKGSVIPENEQSILFDTFTRSQSAILSNKMGWGLGLALVKGLTEAHGGKVSLESNELHGTTFIISLPMDSRK